MYKVLVIDDEFGILEVVQAYLLKEGFEVYTATTGQQGLLIFNQTPIDFIVLDLMLPDLSGEAICQKIRETSQVPILMLTAKKEEEDRITGLELGADDYLLKPFSPKELMIRIHGIIRRVYHSTKVERRLLRFNHGKLQIDQTERVVRVDDTIVELTKNEYDLLLIMAENTDRTFTREQLIEFAFGPDYMGYDRTIDVHIKNIRKKIEIDLKDPQYIVTVFGVGYKFKGVRDL